MILLNDGFYNRTPRGVSNKPLVIRQLLGFFFLFLYCANISFFFFPGKLKTTLVVGIIGFLYYIIKYGRKDPYKLGKTIPLIIPLGCWMSLSIILNQSNQIWFLQYVILQIVYLFGAAFIVDFAKINNIRTILWMIAIYVLIQNFIGFLGIQTPAISDFIRSVEKASFFERREYALGYRAWGFGEHVFFTGGVWTAIAMLVVVFLYKKKYINQVLFWFFVLILLITGLFVARTSLVGLIGFVILLFPLKKEFPKMFKYFLLGGLVVTIILASQKYFIKKNYSTGYAFELFNSYAETGKITTTSSEGTANMWKTLPDNIGTWILGDAKYEDDVRGGYYMQVDVGYLRVIFYGGIVGLFLYLQYSYKLIRRIIFYNGKDYELSIFLYTYFALLLLVMWKGHDDTNIFLYLLLMTSIPRINLRY